jgi:selenocysteine-specific elongation factor
MIVIGTAGHIDHGKSSIVKRLTGTDPDRLPEEQARGMTIDLGFAFYRTPQGEHIALVDVPGHERFVRNMIAGAGGIDVVMLVVAADDGWMPQSQEHFQIVKLLGIKTGLIVINKIDLVEPDWLDVLEQDIREKVSGSFLSDAPIFRVSAQQGGGFEQLTTYLNDLPTKVAARKDIGKARLCIDRSFVRQGIGGVATGTLRGGKLTVGQTVSVWPSTAQGKIRSLQSEGRDVQTVSPGQRTAVALSGVDRSVVARGGVISDRLDLSFFRDNPFLAVSVDLLPDAPVALEDRRRVLLIVGTTEVEAEARIFERSKIPAGENGLVFLKPDQPVYALVGDRFIIRLPTPMITLGGGVILDHLDHFPRRRDLASLDYLHMRVTGLLVDLITSELKKVPMAPADKFLLEADFAAAEVDDKVNRLVAASSLGKFQNWIYHAAVLASVESDLTSRLTEYLRERPHLKGLSREQLVALSPVLETVTLAIVEHMLSTGGLEKIGDSYNLAGRGMSLKGIIKQAYEEIMAQLRSNPYAPPSLANIAALGKNHQQAIRFILESGEGYKVGSEFIFLSSAWREIVEFIKVELKKSNKLAVTQLRDRFGSTRKYAIPILEETDRIRLTRREGDFRVKGDRFESQDTVS